MSEHPTPERRGESAAHAPCGDVPFRHSMLPEDVYAGIDPGIRFAVRVLHAYGIQTNESCEGGEGHAYADPTVTFTGEPQYAEGFAALAALAAYQLPVASVDYHWSVRNGIPSGPGVWRITFSRPLHDQAGQVPTFVRYSRFGVVPA